MEQLKRLNETVNHVNSPRALPRYRSIKSFEKFFFKIQNWKNISRYRNYDCNYKRDRDEKPDESLTKRPAIFEILNAQSCETYPYEGPRRTEDSEESRRGTERSSNTHAENTHGPARFPPYFLRSLPATPTPLAVKNDTMPCRCCGRRRRGR